MLVLKKDGRIAGQLRSHTWRARYDQGLMHQPPTGNEGGGVDTGIGAKCRTAAALQVMAL